MASYRLASLQALRQSPRVANPSARSLHLTGPASNPPKIVNAAQERSNIPALQRDMPSVSHTTRQFNTSRSLKAVKDSSTMDFAYLPNIYSPEVEPERIRVPLLPEASSPRNLEALEDALIPVTRAEILTVSGDSTHIAPPSAMYEVVDNTSVTIDPYTLPEIVSSAAAKLSSIPVKVLNERQGMVKELWESVVDDLLGAKVLKRA